MRLWLLYRLLQIFFKASKTILSVYSSLLEIDNDFILSLAAFDEMYSQKYQLSSILDTCDFVGVALEEIEIIKPYVALYYRARVFERIINYIGITVEKLVLNNFTLGNFCLERLIDLINKNVINMAQILRFNNFFPRYLENYDLCHYDCDYHVEIDVTDINLYHSNCDLKINDDLVMRANTTVPTEKVYKVLVMQKKKIVNRMVVSSDDLDSPPCVHDPIYYMRIDKAVSDSNDDPLMVINYVRSCYYCDH